MKTRDKSGLIVFEPEILLYRGKRKMTYNELCEDRSINRHTFGRGLRGIAVSPVKAIEIFEALEVPDEERVRLFRRAGGGGRKEETDTPEDY